ncbi:GNAT family N-acetyltransferase [Rahnella sikkimica]|uniref:GNAT family N-acetyltransferase n=1 Tax=Rahnella sikkimica TaxID=1805933 RepID=A0A2L1UY66_9GAMM|nr:GNAT family N-acetyltransferase [Rahnella sikkimica]AVF37841.1 GNAT family N-acetyltransferase [Rahnella sikkimica]
MSFNIRQALVSDVDTLFEIRTAVNENHLSREEMRQMGVTESAVAEMILKSRCTWVAVENEKIIGFSMILPDEGCLFAAFVLPEHESKGAGRKLVMVAEQELFKHHDLAWLETDKNSRAATFYKHLGWTNETHINDVDIRLEKKISAFKMDYEPVPK